MATVPGSVNIVNILPIRRSLRYGDKGGPRAFSCRQYAIIAQLFRLFQILPLVLCSNILSFKSLIFEAPLFRQSLSHD